MGVTPSGVERPRCLDDNGELLSPTGTWHERRRPVIPTGPDPKWRYMWRIGPRPSSTKFGELNAEQVRPGKSFPEWDDVMDSFGKKMIDTLETVSRALAIGAGLEQEHFVKLMKMGPHLLAPTGTDLGKHCELGKCFAGFHYDVNFLTIHGKARFPGLNIWLRNGEKLPVKMPSGCLLIQAGKQLEWLTGGVIQAGMHEVVCTEGTLSAVKRAREQGQSLWRVSSTVFGHIASDQLLQPLQAFKSREGWNDSCYPTKFAGQYVCEELAQINL